MSNRDVAGSSNYLFCYSYLFLRLFLLLLFLLTSISIVVCKAFSFVFVFVHVLYSHFHFDFPRCRFPFVETLDTIPLPRRLRLPVGGHYTAYFHPNTITLGTFRR